MATAGWDRASEQHGILVIITDMLWPRQAGIVQQNNMTVDDDCLDTYCAQSQLCRDMRRRGQAQRQSHDMDMCIDICRHVCRHAL